MTAAIVVSIIVSVWLIGTIIAYRKREQTIRFSSIFYGSKSLTPKQHFGFACLWILWILPAALLVD